MKVLSGCFIQKAALSHSLSPSICLSFSFCQVSHWFQSLRQYLRVEFHLQYWALPSQTSSAELIMKREQPIRDPTDSLQHTVWILYYFKRKCWTPCCYTYSPSKKFAYIVCVWESISIFSLLKYEWRNWKLPPFSKTLPGGRSVRHFMFEMTHSPGHLPSLYLVQLDEHRQKQSKTESLCAAVSLWCT